jgi:hypothetical protein
MPILMVTNGGSYSIIIRSSSRMLHVNVIYSYHHQMVSRLSCLVKIFLGCYYLTVNNIKGLLGSSHYFADLDDVILAYSQNKIEIHSAIWVRIMEESTVLSNLIKTVKLNDNTFIEYYENRQVRKAENGEIIVQYLQTTTGRAILNYTKKL